jgi:hypothetical protein
MYFLSRTTTKTSRWSIVQHNLMAPDLSVNKVMNKRKEKQEISYCKSHSFLRKFRIARVTNR